MRGKYIVIEGNDGTGKSTQVKLLRDYLTTQGIESVEYHEPEGTPIANEIRTIIKDGTLKRDSTTNLLLFTAARHEIWQEAEKKLEEGTWVVCSRNYFSTITYQGYGEGLDLNTIVDITERFTSEAYMQPDLAVILSLDHAAREHRIDQREGAEKQSDTFESRSEDFQELVNNGYLQIAKERDIPIVDASGTPGEIAEHIRTTYVESLLSE